MLIVVVINSRGNIVELNSQKNLDDFLTKNNSIGLSRRNSEKDCITNFSEIIPMKTYYLVKSCSDVYKLSA